MRRAFRQFSAERLGEDAGIHSQIARTGVQPHTICTVLIDDEKLTFAYITSIGCGSELLEEFELAISQNLIPAFISGGFIAGRTGPAEDLAVWVLSGQEDAFWQLAAKLTPGGLCGRIAGKRH
jgi:hypothetical protein